MSRLHKNSRSREVRHVVRQGRWRVSGEQGQAYVEFLLVLPLFVVLIVGTTYLGRAWYAKVAAEMAAYDGARTAIEAMGETRGAWQGIIAARQTLAGFYLDPAPVSATYTPLPTLTPHSHFDVRSASHTRSHPHSYPSPYQHPRAHVYYHSGLVAHRPAPRPRPMRSACGIDRAGASLCPRYRQPPLVPGHTFVPGGTQINQYRGTRGGVKCLPYPYHL